MSRPAELQLRLDNLPGFYPAIVRALGEANEDAARIQELTRLHLQVSCLGCRTRFNTEDLAALAFAIDPSHPDSPSLQRLRLGYCPRESCNSRFCIASADSGIVAWPTVFDRTRHWMENPAMPDSTPSTDSPPTPSDPAARTTPSQPDQTPRPALTFQQQWRVLQYRLLGGLVIVAAVFWWVRSGARVPGISPTPRQFEVILPGSENLPTPAQPSPRPQTNSPRSFQIQ
jgi:hypothetical protein